jgi:Domain of unknown function (DUF4288)
MKKVPFASKSPYGWWVATYIERAAWNDERKPTKNGRYLFWENTFILKARNREQAYKKTVRLGSQNRSVFEHAKTGRKEHWEFFGLTSLLPIYEKLEDGAEIFWREFPSSTLRSMTSKIKKKQKLEAFNDSELD